MHSDKPTLSVSAYFDAQAQDLTSQCTRCGKCVEVCPTLRSDSVPPSGAMPEEVITGVVTFLRGGALSDPARVWAEVCMGSGECITACPEHINPRLMLTIVASRIKAAKSERGENPTAAYFKRMSQIINLAAGMQMSPEQYRRLTGRAGSPERSDIVMYLGCNVLRTPVIAFSLLDILDRLGVEYAVLGGVANCCGLVHLKLEGDVQGMEAITSRTIDKMAALNPRTVLQWCPSCVLQFEETVQGFRPYPFEFRHVSDFLVDQLDRLRALFVQAVPRRVALHRHDGGLGIAQKVEQLLSSVPGLEIVSIEEHYDWAYSCGPGALGNVAAAREASHRQTLRSAVEAGAEVLVTQYHTCHRDLAAFEGQYPLEVKNWTTLLAMALGLPEHEDRYKRYKLHDNINAILADAKEFIEANNLDMSAIREILPHLLAGKERGLSVW